MWDRMCNRCTGSTCIRLPFCSSVIFVYSRHSDKFLSTLKPSNIKLHAVKMEYSGLAHLGNHLWRYLRSESQETAIRRDDTFYDFCIVQLKCIGRKIKIPSVNCLHFYGKKETQQAQQINLLSNSIINFCLFAMSLRLWSRCKMRSWNSQSIYIVGLVGDQYFWRRCDEWH